MTPVHIRWMIRRDMAEVLAIENAAFEEPWSEDQFITCLRQRNVIGMVCEFKQKIVGHMLYELHRNRLHLVRLVVSPLWRLQGIGEQMVDKLIGNLDHGKRTRLIVDVPEVALDAQLFLKTCGFRATDIIDDAYRFQFHVKDLEGVCVGR